MIDYVISSDYSANHVCRMTVSSKPVDFTTIFINGIAKDAWDAEISQA